MLLDYFKYHRPTQWRLNYIYSVSKFSADLKTDGPAGNKGVWNASLNMHHFILLPSCPEFDVIWSIKVHETLGKYIVNLRDNHLLVFIYTDLTKICRIADFQK